MDQSSHLTEPGVRSFLCGVLKNCRDKKNALYSKLFNISAFLLFIGLLGGILYYRRKGKVPEEEKKSQIAFSPTAILALQPQFGQKKTAK